MSIKSWLIATGILGVYYIIKNCEVHLFSNASESTCKAQCDAWIAEGASFTSISNPTKAIRDVFLSFNSYLQEINSNPDLGLLDELFEVNETTGLRELPDLVIYLPNGLAIEIIKDKTILDLSSTIPDFIDSMGQGIKIPVMITPTLYVYLAVRLTDDPNFELKVPGTDEWPFVDDLDGQIRKGKDCTPPKAVFDTDIEYIYENLLICYTLLSFLRATGLYKIAKGWITSYLNKRPLKRIRNELKELIEQVGDVSTDLDSSVSILESILKDHFGEIQDISKSDKIYKKIESSKYRPYG